MHTVPQFLGNQRYAQLQSWLGSPTQRAQRVLQVTAAAWWPDGLVPQTRKAAGRIARAQHAHREQAHAGRVRRHA
ncbi:hypothetical protein [Pseudorhodoferax sp.]|uniref:hypothetical protein n=1 Tax=Pseudorhodoferax sp. TaxID=1993553 RepID=UPI002DD62A84|nr:hypothetical protein [Pseudorhodoferax sp.]